MISVNLVILTKDILFQDTEKIYITVNLITPDRRKEEKISAPDCVNNYILVPKRLKN